MQDEQRLAAAAAESDPGQTFDIRPPWIFRDAGRCRSCNAEVAWCEHEHTGRRSPLNPDGTSHFSSCPQADEWRGGGRARAQEAAAVKRRNAAAAAVAAIEAGRLVVALHEGKRADMPLATAVGHLGARIREYDVAVGGRR